jgi:hypothetical protein
LRFDSELVSGIVRILPEKTEIDGEEEEGKEEE